MSLRRLLVPTLALLAGIPLSAADTAPALPAATATSTPGGTIVVSGDRDTTYRAGDAQTATRTTTPIAETPASVQVVPHQVIADQGDIRLKDIIRNVSGVQPVKTEGNGVQFENAYVRGFSQLLYVDGVSFYTMPTLDPAGVDHVEVAKGPASALYGGMEPGGLINIVPKLPEKTARTDISATAGSYDFYRGEADSTGPIGQTIAYRMEAAYQDNDSFRDYLHQQSYFLAPSLTWTPDAVTTITGWAWFQDLQRPQDQGVVFTAKGQPVGPISENLAGPNNSNTQYIYDSVFGLKAGRALLPGLTSHVKLLAHHFAGHEDAIRWNNVSTTNTITPYYDDSQFRDWQYDAIGDLDDHCDLGRTRHEVLLGIELNRNDYHYDRLTDTALPAINIFAPAYPHGPYPLTRGAAQQHTLTDDGAVYLQDQVGLFDDHLHLLAGGRADRVFQHYTSFSNGRQYAQTDTGYSGRAGILYDLTEWLSPYADVGRSFNPNGAGSNLTYSGDPLAPTTGIQYEGGLKANAFDHDLIVTAAVYQITKNHVPVADAAHFGFSVDGGVLRSRGVEFDATGQITPELQIIGNAAYTLTDVVSSTSLPVGAAFINIPRDAGSLWAAYTLESGPLENLGAGLGVFAATRRAGDGLDSFYLPGYARFDAGAWYRFRIPSGQTVHLQVNVDNIFDTVYYESSSGAGSVEPGTPFTVTGTAGVTF